MLFLFKNLHKGIKITILSNPVLYIGKIFSNYYNLQIIVLTNDMSSGGCIILDEADVVAIIATGLFWSFDLKN